MKPKFAVLIAWIVFASTSPLLAVQGDRDNDGLRDEAETNTGLYLSPTDTGTNPDQADTDGDSAPDGMEITKGTNPTSAASRISRPNIILINCDDLGYGDVGCFWQNQRTGTQKFATPGLDSLAAEGMMLTQHYAGAPVCASSRASLLQGRHQGHADIRDSQFDYALPNNHSLASVLQAAGYHTVHVGKAGLAGNIASNAPSGAGLPAHPLYRGFDRFFGYWSHYQGHEHYPRNSTTEKGAFILDDFQKILNANIDLYTTDAWTAFAKKTIVEDTQNTPNRPFFLYLAYDAPHFKNQVPPTRDYPAGKGLNGGIRWAGAPAYASTATNDPAKVDNIENQHSSVNPAWPDVQRRYVSMIRRIDDSVADIVQTLRDLHIDDNTLVVFTSDNGPTIEEGQDPRFFRSFANLEGVKRDIWEGGIREPTIVWWPGRVPASNQLSNIRASALPSAHWDWLPTFAEIAGAPAPSYTDGISLVPTLTGTGVQRQRDYLYFEFNSPGGYTIALPEFPNHGWDPQNQSQAIRIGDLMGVRVNIASPNDSFRIYNVVNDPGQSVNLAGSRPDLQQKMKDIAVSGRRPLAGASRPYDTAALPAVSPGAVTNGIRFGSFEGYWPWLPEFRDMTAVGSGITARPDPAVRSRDRDIGLAFTGYLSVPTTGSYAFTLSSDSGANLWIHDSHVIDNDFNRAATRSSGPVYLSAGLHPIRLYYRHQGGPASLDLSYSGPGISLQAVPTSAYFTEGPAPVIQLNPDDFVISRNGVRIVDVLANDVSNYPLTLTSVGATPSGTASISAGKISFQAANGFWGSSTFPYTATGGATGATSTIRADVLYDNEIWIPLDEGAGISVRTVAGTTSPGGTLNSSGNPAAAWIPGRSGHAMRFDGIDDEVDFPALDLPSGSSPRSFSFWIRTSTRSTDELQTIFSYGANIQGQRLSIRLDNIPGIATDQPLRLEVEGGRVVGTRTLNDGFWHHIACVLSDRNNDGVLDVGETLFYVDGSPDTVSNSASLPMTTSSGSTPCLGGSNHSPGYNFKGDIDDVRIFPRALESSEIAELRSSTGSFIGTQDDSDGDGALDYQEALAGTDPYDGRSVFRINAAASVLRGPVITLHWPAVAGKTYQAEESADLKSWTPVPDVPSYHASADVSDAILNIPANGSARRFFRLSAR